MTTNWVLFSGLGIGAYAVISLMGQLTAGEGGSAVDTVLRLFRPYAFAALVVGNALWVAALYFGLQETSAAVPALIAIGVVTSFVYSVAFLGGAVTAVKLLGVLVTIGGIYLLAR